MTWTKFFDGIYLINLPHRTKRFMDAAEELEKYDIPFTSVGATNNCSTPQISLVRTMQGLFRLCLSEGQKRILVFEDDLDFVENPNNYMPQVIRQLDNKVWNLLSLGPNTHQPLERATTNLLVMKNCRALHAMAYNERAMSFVIDPPPNTAEHLDVLLEDQLQPKGNCYCTYPLLCTQKDGPSDISDETDKSYIVKRFKANTLHLETDPW